MDLVACSRLHLFQIGNVICVYINYNIPIVIGIPYLGAHTLRRREREREGRGGKGRRSSRGTILSKGDFLNWFSNALIFTCYFFSVVIEQPINSIYPNIPFFLFNFCCDAEIPLHKLYFHVEGPVLNLHFSNI